MITVHGNAWRTLYGLLAAVGSMLLAALVNLAAPQAEWLVRPAVVMVVVAGLTWSLLHLPAAIYSLGSVIAAAALTIGGSMAA